MEIGTLQTSTLHTEVVVCKDFSKAKPRISFACRTPPSGEAFQCKQFKRRKGWRLLKVQAVDAAQAFDFETKQLEKLQAQNKLTIGLVGFGNYGQFLAKKLVNQGHTVLAHSRSDYSEVARKMNVQFFRDADDFCEERPEVIVLCTSILSTEAVLHALPVQRLRRSTLFVDVLSVKEFPKNLLLQALPADFDVLCTHPMFGPQSGKDSWVGLPFVYDKIRVGRGSRTKRCEKFLNIFASEGCRMVEMSCEEHDRHAASSQFITHTVGRVLGKLGLHWTPINTKGYETLLDLVNNTGGDSFDLYYGLFMYNINATEELDRLELAFDAVKKQLFSQLHNVLRSQLFDRGITVEKEEAIPVLSAGNNNTEPVSAQLSKLKGATDKLQTVVESDIQLVIEHLLSQGSLDNRLGAKNYAQHLGIDYNHCSHGHYLNVSCCHQQKMAACISLGCEVGSLKEVVYVQQPLGLRKPILMGMVCRLEKPLYGLNQVPLALNKKRSMFSSNAHASFDPQQIPFSTFTRRISLQ